MGKYYSRELKETIVKLYFEGNGTMISLEKEYDISYKTIFNWIRKERLYHTQSNDVFHTRGRKKVEEIDYK